MKLKLSDIKILNEGQQARKLIIEKYGSVQKFVADSKTIIHSNSVESYLSKATITSGTLKYHLTIAFDKSYESLILTKKGQILRFVDLVYDNIKEYKADEDIEVLDRLKDMCRNEKLIVGEAKAHRNAAMYHFYRGDHITAIELLKIGIDLLEDRHEDNLMVSMLSELGLVYFYAQRYEKAGSVFGEIEHMLERARGVEDKTLVLYYFRWGVLYNNTGKHRLAVEMFERSLGYSREKYDVGVALMNLGLANKKQGKYKKAIGYYKKALASFDEHDYARHSIVYNNLAEVYKLKQNYELALKYVNQAIHNIDNSILEYYFLYFCTYSEIKLLQGVCDDTIYELIELLYRAESTFLYRKFLLEGIKTLLELAFKTENAKLIDALEVVISRFIDGLCNSNQEYRQTLLSFLGEIYLYKKRKG